MELRHLRYFTAVAQELSFSEAAKKLFVAQPAISQQIAFLEDELGVKLFHRSKRHVILTPAGNIFYREAVKILNQSEIAIDQAVRASKGLLGYLNIGFLGPPVLHFLPDLVKDFRALFPGIKINLYELNPPEQLEALMNNTIDVGFSRPRNPELYPNISAHTVFKDIFMAVVPENHPLADKKRVTAKDLLYQPLIILSQKVSKSHLHTVINFFADLKESPEIAFEASDTQTILTMAEAECGIGIVPACVENLRHRGVKFLPLSPKKVLTSLCMHWVKGRDDVGLKAFIDLTKGYDIEPTESAKV